MAKHALLTLAAAAAAVAMQGPAQESLGGLAAGEAAPMVNSEGLQGVIRAERLWARAEALYGFAKESEGEYGHPTRVIGSRGHLATMDYIESELAALGGYYNVSRQTFGAVVGHVSSFQLTVDGRVANTTTAMGLSPPTPDRKPVSGRLVLVSGLGCQATDYPATTAGNVALIKRGDCAFGIKSQLAGRAGAVAAVVYNNVPGDFQGSLTKPTEGQVATLGLGGSDGAELANQLTRGRTIPATVQVNATVGSVPTDNVLAQTAGGDADNCVMLGGHSDSVADGPGINDDGSGSLSVLEVAVQLARFRTANCVRFAWWSAEEEGLLGSDHYVAALSPDDRRRVRLFMDYDMMASPNFAYQVYNATDDAAPPGSQALRDLYTEWYRRHGLNYTFVPFDGRSDYDAFIRAGIPAGGIATGAEKKKTPAEVAMFGGVAGEPYDANYHQLGDDLQNLNMTAWETNTKLIAHSVATFAASFDGFPPPKPIQALRAPQWNFHGKNLVM
ncbi:hypothetical protein E4U42_001776 [Claviceps africana]|uniref:Peptide hydrolase n=1 Tax=Claviceps africana TaxID=83212 RepID=A0A8K0J9J1_9HYPO|nr:hypothetical protein E4U42_001776 [Claviceps africana]